MSKVKRYNLPNKEELKTQRELFLEFQKVWSLEKVKNMTLEDYTSILKDNQNRNDFTFWIESKLDNLGSIWGGSSFKFGIYKRNSNEDKGSNNSYSYNDDYGWYTKYGEDIQTAFKTVKENIIKVIEYSMQNDLKSIEKIDLGNAFKWKIAFHYQNVDDIKIVNIFATKVLEKIYFDKFQGKKLEIYQIHQSLLNDKKYTIEELIQNISVPTWNKYTLEMNEEDLNELEDDMDFMTWINKNARQDNGELYSSRSKENESSKTRTLKDVEKYQSLEELVQYINDTKFDKIKNDKPGRNFIYTIRVYSDYLNEKFYKQNQILNKEEQEKRFGLWLQIRLNNKENFIQEIENLKNEFLEKYNKDLFSIYKLRELRDILGEEEYQKTIKSKNTLKEFARFLVKDYDSSIENIFFNLPKYINYSHQLIFYGAPGTGKSYELNKRAEDNFSENNIERVTFHPSLTYGAFVGSFKPYSKDEKITYKYIAGVFIRHLVKALKNENENYLLIIEEINRANTAAVFGDMFQLLDRDKNGESEYEISISDELKEYLDKESVKNLKNNKLYLPNNFYIWATMNNADQGVMPLDTAFKRRWDFEYMPLDADSENKKLSEIEEKWNKLRKAINEKLLSLGINEDKLLGFYFLNGKALENEENYLKALQNKVLMYLYEDVLRHCRVKVFGNLAFANISQMSLEDIEKLFVNKQNEAE